MKYDSEADFPISIDRDKLERKSVIVGGLAGATVTGLAGVIAYFLNSEQFIYGTLIFCFSPLVLGFVAQSVAEKVKGAPTRSAYAAAMWGTAFALLGTIVCVLEGFICVIMAAPLAFLMAWFGAFIYKLTVRVGHNRLYFSFIPIAAVCAIYDSSQGDQVNTRTETTRMMINASAEKIWPYVLSIDHATPDPILNLGFAHPLSTQAFGTIPTSSRVCRLSTGDMPEVITRIVPNRLLEFKVLHTPPSMREMNPFGEIHPKHLDGYYISKMGVFRLSPLKDGKTLLEGTSTYQLRIFPEVYWTVWSDFIVDRIHQSVMSAIAEEATRTNAGISAYKAK